MMKRTIGWIAAAALAAGALAGCSGHSGTSATRATRTGGDLVMARGVDVTSLIPSVAVDNASIWVIEEIYDTLTVPSADGKGVKPSLAKSWTQSADKLSWTFTLRDNATFSNGQRVTSADVKFSIDQNRKAEAPLSFINAAIDKIETPTPTTVVFHTRSAWSPLPADLALFSNSIVPANYAGKSAAQFGDAPIGSGPFTFDSWQKGSQLKIVKNKSYWKPSVPALDSVTFKVVPDGNTRATQLASKQIQVNEFPPFSSVKSLQKQPSVQVKVITTSQVNYLTLNTRQAPFNDGKVRTAISQAIDRAALLKVVLYGLGSPANSFLSPTTWAHDSALPAPTQDLAAARQSLAGSSVPHGFSTTIATIAGDQNQATQAELIQSDLAKIGITAKIQQLDASALNTQETAGHFAMAFDLYTTDIVDPDEIARYAATSDAGNAMLHTGYNDPQLRKLADQATATSDQAKRKVAYDQMQSIIADAKPYLPLYYAPEVYALSSDVVGFSPGATGNYFLENVKLAK